MFLAGMSDADIGEALRDRLKDELSVGSTAERGSREKTITLLLRTWVRVPPPLRELRQDGVWLLQSVHRTERLPLHWGMTSSDSRCDLRRKSHRTSCSASRGAETRPTAYMMR
jgi:hypothetical protein